MKLLRVLIIENEAEWQSLVKEALVGLECQFDLANDRQEAKDHCDARAYDLITLDLSLISDAKDPNKAAEDGLALLEEIRQSPDNHDTAIVVITGYPTFDRFDRILGFRQAYRLLIKQDFSKRNLCSVATHALQAARFGRAYERLHHGRRELVIRFLEDCWVGCRLSGRKTFDYIARRPVEWASTEFSKGGDSVIGLLRAERKNQNPGEQWRPHARFLGTKLIHELRRDDQIRDALVSARDTTPDEGPLTLRFTGPTAGLRVPFEILRDNRDYLALSHSIVRQVTGKDIPANFREPSFSRFAHSLAKPGHVLKILLVGADAEGSYEPLASVREEIQRVEEIVRLELEQRLGFRLHTLSLIGAEATPERVREALEDGYHVLHYAGHGTFSADHPEASGLVLWKDGKPKVLAADELLGLVEGSHLRLAILNCCLGAQTASESGRGDFHGVLEALVKAGVPWVLAHRWPVPDDSASQFAYFFHQALWRTFEPELAILETRQRVARLEPLKRDDAIWASSILVSQSG